MNTRTLKVEEAKSRSVANSVTQKKNNKNEGFSFVDNRLINNNITQVKAANVIQAANIQRAVIQRHNAAGISLNIIANKSSNGLDNVSDSSIRLFVRTYFTHNIVNDSTRESTVINSVETAIKSYLKPDSGGGHVPSDKETEKDVNGTTYRFYNDTEGCLEFMSPRGGKPSCPKAGGVWEVNIEDPANQGRTKLTDKPLNSGSRPQHFKVSNMIYEGTNNPVNGSSSPAGYTWHHHKDKGKMQLIDRDVHASFSHKGGFSIWGS